jgi:hypothetical protein
MGVLSAGEIQDTADPSLLSHDGTQVIWSDCDRLSENWTLTEEQFNRLIAEARRQLSLVFHRYLSGEVRGRKLSILVNGLNVEPYDPFYADNPATQRLEREELRVGDGSLVTIEPFILPHYSKLALSDYDRLAGEEGLLRNQGFYVYRQYRLIISGTWFRLVKHGELAQLVRIRVDIPNALDAMWKITVDKSDAQLPAVLRRRLVQIVGYLRRKSAKVIRSKGGKADEPGRVPVWRRHARDGEINYSINREHPLIVALLEDGGQPAPVATAAIRAIEQAIPLGSLGSDLASSSHRLNQISSDPRDLLDQLEVALPPMLLDAQGNTQALEKVLSRTEPFAQNWALVEDHLRKKGWKQ